MTDLILVGRTSSHFTRVARIFAIELAVRHVFRPVFDLTSPDPVTYANNPALKVPVLVDGDGPLFGTENICRDLARRSPLRGEVVLRGAVLDRLVANAEEMTLHAMSAEVSLLMARATGNDRAILPKIRPSLENALRYLNDHVDGVLRALPCGRDLSFIETALFCLVTHLPFREVIAVTPYDRLKAFCERFGMRESARETAYRFDSAG
jgi:glutathione S-transferase